MVESMYPELRDARAAKSQTGDGLLLVDLQTTGRSLRFAVTIEMALRLAEWLAKVALGTTEPPFEN